MFDESRLKEALVSYKRDFAQKLWPNEKYKWQAVKCFQVHWDVNAADFADMLEKSLSATGNLLASKYNTPADMIEKFAKAAPEDVRAMFIELFDESKDVYERIDSFKKKASILLERYGNGDTNHYQNENSISIYLWLRYPDKYYIFKLNEVKAAARKLEGGYRFRKGAYTENIRNCYVFYNEICTELQKDAELRNMLAAHIDDSCYGDPELHTLTIDVGFYISRYYDHQNDPAAVASVSEVDIEKLHSEARYKQWFVHVIDALRQLGGTAPRPDVHEKIIDMCAVSKEERAKKNKSGVSIVDNDIDWARNYLTYEGFLEKTSTPGMWKLSFLGESIQMTDELAGKIIAKWVKIKACERENQPIPTIDLSPYYIPWQQIEKYGEADFLSEVYLTESRYHALVSVLKNKKNIILQGAPGVGKTFAAKRLAWSMMGEKDESRIEFVQFHQNYSYEDFVMGYKPVDDGFALHYGIFYRFCQRAASQSDKDFFFIIDEINRGNMSKIFGELLMLIEKNYRGTEVTLAYNGLPFSVPKNLYLIGMMNTADRSLAMIDYALRRRFSFFEMVPGFDSEGFSRYQASLNNETLNELIDRVKELNREITADKSLGKGFCIGHSYFCGQNTCTDEWLDSIVNYDILPMLSEYWFDDTARLQRWENILRGVLQ